MSRKSSVPVREKAYQHLRSSVLSGRYAPGERLTEERLAKELGISRTPVREALYRLESEGLIQQLETRGFVVAQDTKEDVEELFEIRAVLEGYALRTIADRITDEVLQQLERVVREAERALESRQLEALFESNTRFHDMLHELIRDKRRLYGQMVNMRKYVLRYRRDTLQSPEGASRTLDGHRRILLALRLRDPDLCERLMREHIKKAERDAVQSLFDQQLEDK
ncbi:MAG: GntR family transcriptional regulator [Sphingomonadaceae bacterium]